MERHRRTTKIRLSMTGCMTGGSEALKGNEKALNDDGKSLKGIAAIKRPYLKVRGRR